MLKDDAPNLKAENEALKKQIEAKQEHFRKENAWLVTAVQGLKEENLELQRREDEAVEQVRQSVNMAEQISMEKTQLDMELNQSKVQLDRQQERIRNLIEEQVEKVEEVRQLTEQRCQEEFAALRQQAEVHAGQLGHLTAELDQSQRREVELRRQLKEQKTVTDKLSEDADKRIGHSHLEVVNLKSLKQQVDHDLDCVRIDLDHARADLEATNTRHKSEVESFKSRLARSEQLLDECRSECLKLAEAKSQLERECNLHRIANGDKRPLLELNEETIGQLRGIIQRQKHIIDELRTQCTGLASKLEAVSTSYSDQVAKLGHQLGESLSQIQIQEGQAKQYGQMYEVCCRRVAGLESENQRLKEDLERVMLQNQQQQQQQHFKSVSVHHPQTNGVQRVQYQQQQQQHQGRKNHNHHQRAKASPVVNGGSESKKKDGEAEPERDQQHYQQTEAIVIEQNGQLLSPFSAAKNNH